MAPDGSGGLSRAEKFVEADKPNMPAEYAALKRSIIKPEDEAAVIKSWAEILDALQELAKEVEERGSEIIPQVEFSELATLSDEQKAEIKRTGSVVVRNVVDDGEGLKWKEGLKAYVEANPQCVGHPDDNKQFFQIYWSPPQVQARSHPSIISALAQINSLYTLPPSSPLASLRTPITWADRFRIRHPNGEAWTRHPPHIDGPSIGRWSNANMRECYAEIFRGKWKECDPYLADRRVRAKSNFQTKDDGFAPQTIGSVFHAFQGWLALSSTGPGEGTLKVFPRIQLSTAYVLLRPFFKLASPDSDPLKAESWVFDTSSAHFPGLYPGMSIRVTEGTHPGLRPETLMVCVPRVEPGDMVFWHNDVPHAVQEEHNGANDSSVMYIGALPLTVSNAAYLVQQRASFLSGSAPPDFQTAPGNGEATFTGRGSDADLRSVEGRRAMGLEKFEEAEGMNAGEKELVREVNRLIAV